MVELKKTLPPALQVRNLSVFDHLVFSALDTDDEMHDVVVVKGAYALGPTADPSQGTSLALKPAPEASVICVVDAYFGEANTSSVRTESDLAPFKPKCDVVVVGSAYSPSGQPVQRVTVGIEIDDGAGRSKLSHRLAICGPRDLVKHTGLERSVTVLARSLGGDVPDWFLDEPGAFLDMPLRYEMAFGGELKVSAEDVAAERLKSDERLSDEVRTKHPAGAAAPVAHTVCRCNPLGCGFVETWHVRATRATRYPAPRIEAVGAPLSAELLQALAGGRSQCGSDPALTPQGFGVVTKAWQPRLKLAGTFDETWRTSRAPFLPKDFDMAYWNGAHPAMQCSYLYGGEIVTLTNLMASGSPGTRRGPADETIADFRIPAAELALRTKFDDGRVICALLPIDTFVIDLDAALVHLAWRIRIPSGVAFADAALVSLSERRELVAARAIAAA